MKVNKFVKGFAAIALFSLVLAGCGAERKTTQRTLAQHLQKRKNQLNHQHQRKSCRWRFKRWYV